MKPKLLMIISFFCYGMVQAQTFTDNTPGTNKIYTIPADVSSVTVAIWGGGGAGGASSYINLPGGGGGGGGASTRIFEVSSATNIIYTVGTGGKATGMPKEGTSSSLTYTASSVSMFANGGKGGSFVTSGNALGGNGGTASGGTINSSGVNGLTGISNASLSGKGGNSGSVIGVFGSGGAGVSSSNNGLPGGSPGAGGSGALSSFVTHRPGGAGASGRFFIRYISVTSVSPTSVCPGQTITISGLNFSTSAGTTVTINAVSCIGVTVVNPTTITAVVPETSTSGVVLVSNANGTNNTKTITILEPTLAMTNVSKTMAIAGMPTIFHTNCSDLISSVEPNGISPVNGNTDAKVWIESTQPVKHVKRHYEISPATSASTATGRVTLYFTQAEFDDFNAVNLVDLPAGPADALGKSNLLIEKRTGLSNDGTGLPGSYTGSFETIDPADTDIIWNGTSNRWEINVDITGFGGFFIKTQASTLPLRLLSFTAGKQTQFNLLQWKTADENNSKQFVLERSVDGVLFNSIATIAAKGTGNGNYSYKDNNITKGTIFYRLRLVDNDARFSYSQIVVLHYQSITTVSVYPNPAKNMITLHLSDHSLLNSIVKLTDINGRVIATHIIKSNSELIDISTIQTGIYLLQMADGSVQKMIKE